MEKRIIDDLELGNENQHIYCFITTNHGGYSTGSYSSFNLGKWCGEDPDTTQKNYNLLAKDICIKSEHIFIPREIHGNKAVVIDQKLLEEDVQKQYEHLSKADALITQLPDIAIGITTADCVPIIGYDNNNTIVAIHAGWRGIVGGVIDSAITKMQEISNSRNYTFLIGPCINGNNYEIGGEVWEEFKGTFNETELSLILKKRTLDKYFPDIRTAAEIQLLKYTDTDRIKHFNSDTYRDSRFYSVRRDGLNTGRFVTGIALKQPY